MEQTSSTAPGDDFNYLVCSTDKYRKYIYENNHLCLFSDPVYIRFSCCVQESYNFLGIRFHTSVYLSLKCLEQTSSTAPGDEFNYLVCSLAMLPLTSIEKQVRITTYLGLFGPRREKTCLWRFAINKGADQPAHPRSLTSAFAIHLLEIIIFRLATSEIPIFLLVSVAEETGLSLAL